MLVLVLLLVPRFLVLGSSSETNEDEHESAPYIKNLSTKCDTLRYI